MLSGHQRITWRRNIAENFNRLSRVHERYRRQTTDDRRQTDDRQTDGRTTTNSEREHEFTFAKNVKKRFFYIYDTQSCSCHGGKLIVQIKNVAKLPGRLNVILLKANQTRLVSPALTYQKPD